MLVASKRDDVNLRFEMSAEMVEIHSREKLGCWEEEGRKTIDCDL